MLKQRWFVRALGALAFLGTCCCFAWQPAYADVSLSSTGMGHGAPNAAVFAQFQAAVRQYQQKNNLGSSGQLDQQTLASLNIGGGGPNYGNNDNGRQPGNQASGNMQPPASQQNAQSNQQGGSVTR